MTLVDCRLGSAAPFERQVWNLICHAERLDAMLANIRMLINLRTLDAIIPPSF